MDYDVMITEDAEKDLSDFLYYIIFVKRNKQAAKSLNDDYKKTIIRLQKIAGSLKLDEDADLAKLGYRRIRFDKHNYFMLYRIEGNKVYVDRIFHDLQDYKNHIYIG